jgi:hypothetical protein
MIQNRAFILYFFLFLCQGFCLLAQIEPIPIGNWRSHFDYTKGKCLAKAGNKVYCAADNGFFVFDITENETKVLSLEDGFSNLKISQLAYHESSKTLVIAYENGLIDLAKLDQNAEVTQISTIKNIFQSPTILDSKATNQIIFFNNIAIFATDFGIVQIDLTKKLIKETDLNLGELGVKIKINSVALLNGKLYASANKYLLAANFNEATNLQNYESWNHIKLPRGLSNGEGVFNKVAVLENKLVCAISENGLFSVSNETFTSFIIFKEKINDFTSSGSRAFLSFSDKIAYIDATDLKANAIPEQLVKKPKQILVESQKIWVADNQNGLISNIYGAFQKYNPNNSPGLISTRNDSVVIDNQGITWTKLAPGNGLQITDKQGNKKIFNRIPLVDNNNRFASNTVNSLAIDKNKNYSVVYVATDAGIVAVNTSAELFKTSELDGFITTPRIDGVRILQNEVVLSIAIDGGNRKWCGTTTGLFLFNDDLNQIIEKFTVDNAPLPSNTINFLNLEPEKGELFIYTPNGIVSYRTGSTEGAEIQSNNVLVFPNPIRPEFDGLVGISGLVSNAIVKITDISGRLVFQTKANGGTATWNITAQNGRRAETGIYYIFSSNELGQETMVSKVAIIK